ncbi:MAG: Trypsin-like serine protease [Labilithrix sp.]|nr:Trypsin-like serine protease [Labilithrix sp.]
MFHRHARHGLPLVAAAALLACSTGKSPSDDGAEATRATSSALQAAPLDTTHPFAVGICVGPLADADAGPGAAGTCRSSTCTGTLVAPNLVLTARHCFDFPDVTAPLSLCLDHAGNKFPNAPIDVTQVRITTAPSVRVGAPTWRTVKSVTVPTTTAACDDDIGLVQLNDNVAAADALPIAADLFTDIAADKPSAVTIVGRGAIDESYDPATGEHAAFDRGDYTRRILTNVPVVCISNTDGTCKLLDYTFMLPPNGFDLSKNVFTIGPSGNSGDSGAGVLDQKRFDGGKPTVIGVYSYGGVDATGKGYAGFAVRLPQHKELITNVATAAAAAGSYTVPAWVSAAPVVDVPDVPPPDAGPDHPGDGGGSGADASVPADGGSGGSGPSDDGCSMSRAPGTASGSAGLAGVFLALGLVAARRRRA